MEAEDTQSAVAQVPAAWEGLSLYLPPRNALEAHYGNLN